MHMQSMTTARSWESAKQAPISITAWRKKFGMKDLGTLGGNFSSAQAINDAAQIVGQAETNQGPADAFLLTNGSMLNLGSLGGLRSRTSGGA